LTKELLGGSFNWEVLLLRLIMLRIWGQIWNDERKPIRSKRIRSTSEKHSANGSVEDKQQLFQKLERDQKQDKDLEYLFPVALKVGSLPIWFFMMMAPHMLI